MIKRGYYRHYKYDKNGFALNYTYEVIGTCLNTEDKKIYVLYKPLYKDSNLKPNDYYIRSCDMFTEKLMINGKSINRFKLISGKKDIELINTEIKKQLK